MCLPPLPACRFIFFGTLSIVYTIRAATCEDTDIPRNPEDLGRNSNIGSHSAGRVSLARSPTHFASCSGHCEGPALMPHYARPAPRSCYADPTVVLGPALLSIPLHGPGLASPCYTHRSTFYLYMGYPP
ncbi:hypothetical protein P691DRAFT_810581 [Macrolepiota fuliginosa MF-IS2]|uniref:Secreted protein n=1 Tax=Macrolepiota fuliginosa MF-IS2 TaxID=1400762 RepID=A0A9P5X3B0_9AGAR|nr:hypothetical protein P691DRAFT_810581 [Macrolepiota fuliginosa MF-IS2]